MSHSAYKKHACHGEERSDEAIRLCTCWPHRMIASRSATAFRDVPSSAPKAGPLAMTVGSRFQSAIRIPHSAFWRASLLLLLSIAWTHSAFADNRITLELSPKKISMYENSTLEITIVSDSKNLPQPQLPPLTDFQIFSSGRSQNIQLINGKISASVTYTYVLAPRHTGRFVVGPATITIDGQVYTSGTEAIIINDAPAPKAAPQPNQDPAASRTNRERKVFITGSLDNDTVYVNQPVTFIFRFYSGERLLSNPEYQRPAFTGFWVEDLPPQRKYSTTIEGVPYEVTEIRTALFPAEAGTKTIPPAEVNATVRSARRRNNARPNPFNLFDDSFFDRGETVRLASEALRLVVLPTPQTQITPEPSGLVGNFEIRASTDTRQVNVGDPITVSVTITGEGNVKAIPSPYRDTLPNFRMFSGGTSEKITTSDYRIRGSKTFDETFVPQRAGTYSLPAFALTYFDPKKKAYETARTEPIEITVTGGAADFTIPSLKLEPDQLSDLAADVRFLKTDGENLRRVSAPGLFGMAFWAGHVLPLLGLIGFLTWRRGVVREAADPVGRRRRLAARAAIVRLRGEDGKVATQPLTYSELSEALMQYYTDRYNVSAQGQTRAEVRATLALDGLSEVAIGGYIELLDLCDRGRYALSDSEQVPASTVDRAESIIAAMEARS